VSAFDPEQIAIFYFPLRGMRAEEEPVAIADVMLLEPTFEDWRSIEKTDVADQMLGAAMGERLGVPVAGARPPLCLVTHVDWPSTRDNVHPMALVADVEPAVIDVLFGLRLLKDDAFLDFEYAGRYVTAPSEGFTLSSRLPGPYRQTDVDIPDDDRYSLRRDELQDVEELALLCRAYREATVDSAGAIALENFRHAHAIHVSDVDRLAFLFVALEALFGGYNEREPFGRVPLAARAAADDETRAYLAGEGRRLRNAVAHGNPPARELAVSVSRLLGVIRAGLVDYMWFSIWLDETRPEVVALVGERAASSSRMRVFNELLARWREGDERAARLLSPEGRA
jgi:hypothetical protein